MSQVVTIAVIVTPNKITCAFLIKEKKLSDIILN
jgi:hypothetical protein